MKFKYPPHIVDMLDAMETKPLSDDSPLRNQEFIKKLNAGYYDIDEESKAYRKLEK